VGGVTVGDGSEIDQRFMGTPTLPYKMSDIWMVSYARSVNSAERQVINYGRLIYLGMASMGLRAEGIKAQAGRGRRKAGTRQR
jgi:hypothetical protein